MTRRNLVTVMALVSLVLGGCGASTQDRQAEVAEKGRAVMPFDLDKTTHRFLPIDDGLREEVVADQRGDTTQITISYVDLPDGASLTFTTADPTLVRALHDWGEAQTSDHGGHAEHGTG